jgi:hypothetical protein
MIRARQLPTCRPNEESAAVLSPVTLALPTFVGAILTTAYPPSISQPSKQDYPHDGSCLRRLTANAHALHNSAASI